jgi:hypothetical protein
MARKMTAAQELTLSRINAGWPESFIHAGEPPALASALLRVCMGAHHCMDGELVRCHRTVLTDTPAGSQTQSFRIHPDGKMERKL